MPSKWLAAAEAELAGRSLSEDRAISAISAISSTSPATTAPIGTIGTIGTGRKGNASPPLPVEEERSKGFSCAISVISADSSEPVQVVEDLDERAAIVEEGAGVPREWAEGFARLSIMRPPEGVAAHRWRQLIDNAGRFIDRFAVQAHRLGWDTVSVFGCHPHRPDARLDLQGLVWLIGDGELVAIGDTTARIKTRTGSALTYRRRPVDRREPVVAAWELIREVR
jgi:hypothetical protein